MTETLESRYPPPADPPLALDGVVRLADFEQPARERLHPAAWSYYAGGSWDEHTLRDTLASWSRYRLRPRVLVDVEAVDLRTTLLGSEVAMPFGIAPAALHGMAHAEGECATARAAAAAGVLQVVSTVASRSIEEVAAAAPGGPRWFQLYVQRDRSASRDLVQRAEAAGYGAIALTVDLPVLGYRDDVLRTDFDPGRDAYANLPKRAVWDGDIDEVLDMRSVGLTWDDLATIRGWSSLPLVLKGILTAEDARLAVEHGAAAVWVSNHGGRQLDRVAASIDVLAEVVEAVDGRAEVYLDGGVRRGPDVAIALAMGARAVFAARPFLYALACAGEAGVAHALAIVREETLRTFALLGVRSPAELTRAHVERCRVRPRILSPMTTELPVDPSLVEEAAALDIESAAARHAGLVEQIERANRLYHVEDAPEISDAEYDQLFRRAGRARERLSAARHPGFADPARRRHPDGHDVRRGPPPTADAVAGERVQPRRAACV